MSHKFFDNSSDDEDIIDRKLTIDKDYAEKNEKQSKKENYKCQMSQKLFEDSSDDEDINDNKLTINKDYADKYEKWRRKEDYERLKAKYGVKDFDSEDSDSEDSDDKEYIEPDNPEFDMDFFRVLAAVRTKHPILDKKEKFFKDSYQSEVKKKDEKPLSIADYERKRLLEKSENNDDEEDIKPGCSGIVKENEDLLNSKEKFKFDDNLSDDDGEDLFIKKEEDNHSEDSDQKESEAVEFLRGKRNSLSDKLDEELLTSLKKDWKTNMSKEDKFLMDYFVNKRYLEEEDEAKERSDNHYILDFEPLEDDEDTYNRMEEFETKYRFRFEEPDQEFIHRYPRVIEDAFRKKDTRRKEERDKKQNKLKEEEERKKQELLRLKALKKQEIMDRIEMLKETAGIAEVDPNNFDLEADFDPEKHDALMSQFFNDKYYNEEAESDKPKFEDEELQRELEEEYEKLKELDNIAEGTFKYADVLPNSYGLSTEEILFAKDTELNRWCSINRILKYGQGENEEKKIRINFGKRGENDHVKYKIIPSLYSENIEEHWEAEEERRRKRNLKKKERKQKKLLKMQEEESTLNPNTSEGNNLDPPSGLETETNIFEKGNLSRADSTNDSEENDPTFPKEANETKSFEQNSLIDDSQISKKKKKKNKLKDSATVTENTLESYKINHEDENFINETENCVGNAEEQGAKAEKAEKKKKKDISENNYKAECSDLNLKEKSNKASEVREKRSEVVTTINNKNKKRKRGKDVENDDTKKFSKKTKLSHDKLDIRNQLALVSDARMLSYGQNPKKIKKYLKYSARFNKMQ